MGTPHLPEELTSQIFSYLELPSASQRSCALWKQARPYVPDDSLPCFELAEEMRINLKTLVNATRASKSFQRIAEAFLYRTFPGYERVNIRIFAAALARSPQRASFVRGIVFDRFDWKTRPQSSQADESWHSMWQKPDADWRPPEQIYTEARIPMIETIVRAFSSDEDCAYRKAIVRGLALAKAEAIYTFLVASCPRLSEIFTAYKLYSATASLAIERALTSLSRDSSGSRIAKLVCPQNLLEMPYNSTYAFRSKHRKSPASFPDAMVLDRWTLWSRFHIQSARLDEYIPRNGDFWATLQHLECVNVRIKVADLKQLMSRATELQSLNLTFNEATRSYELRDLCVLICQYGPQLKKLCLDGRSGPLPHGVNQRVLRLYQRQSQSMDSRVLPVESLASLTQLRHLRICTQLVFGDNSIPPLNLLRDLPPELEELELLSSRYLPLRRVLRGTVGKTFVDLLGADQYGRLNKVSIEGTGPLPGKIQHRKWTCSATPVRKDSNAQDVSESPAERLRAWVFCRRPLFGQDLIDSLPAFK